MKKVLAAALLCAVSAFATWDYFPVKDAGKGEGKVGFAYNMLGDYSQIGTNEGVRYTVIQGLEVAFMSFGDGLRSGFMISEDPGDRSGLSQPVIGVRYWLPMGLGIAADFVLPLGGEKIVGDDPDMALSPAVQYSTKLSDALELGSQVGTTFSFGDADEGLDLDIGVELDFSMGKITPFVGVDLSVGLTKGDKAEASKMGIFPSVGAIYEINEKMTADASIGFGLGDGGKIGDDTPIFISLNYTYGF
jgi:hypothetical protein